MLHLEDGGVSVRIDGLDAGAAQQVRNVVGVPAVRLKTARRVDVRG